MPQATETAPTQTRAPWSAIADDAAQAKAMAILNELEQSLSENEIPYPSLSGGLAEEILAARPRRVQDQEVRQAQARRQGGERQRQPGQRLDHAAGSRCAGSKRRPWSSAFSRRQLS